MGKVALAHTSTGQVRVPTQVTVNGVETRANWIEANAAGELIRAQLRIIDFETAVSTGRKIFNSIQWNGQGAGQGAGPTLAQFNALLARVDALENP